MSDRARSLLRAVPAPASHLLAAYPVPDAAGAAVVVVVGELDLARVAELDLELRRAAAGAELVVVDLRMLEFIDESGVRLLLAADRRIRESGGRMLVVRDHAEIDWLFALLGVDRGLELVDWPQIRAVGNSDREVVFATGETHRARVRRLVRRIPPTPPSNDRTPA